MTVPRHNSAKAVKKTVGAEASAHPTKKGATYQDSGIKGFEQLFGAQIKEERKNRPLNTPHNLNLSAL